MSLDTTLIRIVVLLLCLFAPFLIVIYILMACFLPGKYTADGQPDADEHTDDAEKTSYAPPREGKFDGKRRSELVKIACYSVIVGALILIIINIIFAQKATFTNFVRYTLFFAGVFLFFSAFLPHTAPGSKKVKITVALMIILLDTFTIFNNAGFIVANASNIKTSIDYTWPLLAAGLGATILFRSKTFIKIMWIILAVFVITYAILINRGICLF